MITKEIAGAFAKEWVDAWNSHDIEKILSQYSEDFTIESPMAVKLYPQSKGIVKGKSEVRKYWTIGLDKSPDLKFELLEVLVGINSISLYIYNSASKRKSVELMSFNQENKVNKAIVTYSE
ncbi:MAG: nuclear transport factor 2 family protein [Flavobacterium sp.]|uniref:YybH family protein n=1 Tax=Flavobacterium sp. TaxID=239 RepID=UPI003263144E